VVLKALSYSTTAEAQNKKAGATGMFTQTASNNNQYLAFGKNLEFDLVILTYLT
jgi:hypothetical protein